MSCYEELRKKNIEDNKRILAEIGIRNPFKPLPTVRKQLIKRKRNFTGSSETVKRRRVEVVEGDIGTEYSSGRRRSTRLKGIKAPDIQEIQDDIGKNADEEKLRRKSLADRPMIYGAIPGVEVGTWWATRIECNHANIHRPTVAGIHPGPEGAYSIALSGGYEDDIDMGDCFTYTGEGGRDLKGTANNPKNLRTAPQSCDQKLSRGNAALVNSVETKKPVRVIRGYKLPSPFAPEEGYRYDGLYLVEKYWYTTGMAGFGVFKFALRRLTEQAPPPWDIMDSLSDAPTYSNSDSNNNSKIEVIPDTSVTSNRLYKNGDSDFMKSSGISHESGANTRNGKVADNISTDKVVDNINIDKVDDNSSTHKVDDTRSADIVDGSNSDDKVCDNIGIDKVDYNSSTDKVNDNSRN